MTEGPTKKKGKVSGPEQQGRTENWTLCSKMEYHSRWGSQIVQCIILHSHNAASLSLCCSPSFIQLLSVCLKSKTCARGTDRVLSHHPIPSPHTGQSSQAWPFHGQWSAQPIDRGLWPRFSYSRDHMTPTWKGTGRELLGLLLSNPVLKDSCFLSSMFIK